MCWDHYLLNFLFFFFSGGLYYENCLMCLHHFPLEMFFCYFHEKLFWRDFKLQGSSIFFCKQQLIFVISSFIELLTRSTKPTYFCISLNNALAHLQMSWLAQSSTHPCMDELLTKFVYNADMTNGIEKA